MDWQHGNPTGNTTHPAWLARRDARARLLAVVPLIIALSTFQQLTSVFIFSLIISIFYISGCRHYGRGGLAMLSTSLLLPWSVDSGGFQVAMLYLGKCITQFMLVALVWQSAPLHVHASAAQRLGMPAILCQLFTLMWRNVQLLSSEWHRIKLAMQTRYFRHRFNQHSRQTLSHAMGTMIVRTHQRGERVSQVMRCRGFRGQFHQLHETAFTLIDSVFVLISWGVMSGFIWWDRFR